MALKLYVKLQTPTIELPIEAKDISGMKDSFKAGFKRYPVTEAQDKIKELQDIWERKGSQDETVILFDSFLKGEIVYLKNVTVPTEDEKGNIKQITIQDTRTVKPLETLWETPEECLDVLLEAFLDCAPTRVSLQQALTSALINADYKEAEKGN
jgi:hypothetical protein